MKSKNYLNPIDKKLTEKFIKQRNIKDKVVITNLKLAIWDFIAWLEQEYTIKKNGKIS